MLKAITSTQPYFALKMELVDLLIDSKAFDEAIDDLKSAAGSNFMYDVQGQHDYQEVQARVIKLKELGQLKPAQEGDIQKIQQEWLKQNQLATEEKAEQKKQEAIAEKEAADNAAKQKAATDKQKADAAKSGKGPAPATAGTPKVSVNVPGVTATVKPSTTPPPATTPVPAKTGPGQSPPPNKKQ